MKLSQGQLVWIKRNLSTLQSAQAATCRSWKRSFNRRLVLSHSLHKDDTVLPCPPVTVLSVWASRQVCSPAVPSSCLTSQHQWPPATKSLIPLYPKFSSSHKNIGWNSLHLYGQAGSWSTSLVQCWDDGTRSLVRKRRPKRFRGTQGGQDLQRFWLLHSTKPLLSTHKKCCFKSSIIQPNLDAFEGVRGELKKK